MSKSAAIIKVQFQRPDFASREIVISTKRIFIGVAPNVDFIVFRKSQKSFSISCPTTKALTLPEEIQKKLFFLSGPALNPPLFLVVVPLM